MKECRKCKKEFKDEYSFCPNCGKPYDANLKNVSVPAGGSKTWKVICNITNILLYVASGILLIGLLATIGKLPLFAISGILFCLSLFRCFYSIVENKLNVDSKKILIARFVVPFIFLILWIVLTGVEGSNTNEDDVQVQTIDEIEEVSTETIE